MPAIPPSGVSSLREGAKQLGKLGVEAGQVTGGMFKTLATRTRDQLGKADMFVKSPKAGIAGTEGVWGTAKYFAKEKPVTTAAAVAGTAVVGGYMASNLTRGGDRSENRAR